MKYFEITYAPNQWNAPQGGIATQWNTPYGGLHVQAPANMIGPQYSPGLVNVWFRNCELKSRPALTLFHNAPATNQVSPPDSFFSRGGFWHSVVVDQAGMWQWVPGTQSWSAGLGGFGVDSTQVPPIIPFQGIVYWTGSNPTNAFVSAWDGAAASALSYVAFSGAVNPPGAGQVVYGARYMGELANRLVLLYTFEQTLPTPSTVNTFPQRVRWSNNGFDPTGAGAFGSNLGTSGATFDPTINVGAGFTDLLDVPDKITGATFLGRMGYIFRTDGISEMSPTGVGTAPFDFNHLWASQNGIGSVYPFTIAQYGNSAMFVATDNIYLMTPSATKAVGGGARDQILADISSFAGSNNNSASGAILPMLFNGTVTGPFLAYYLVIPLPGTGTRVYVYNIEDDNWTNWLFTGQILGPPGLMWTA